MARPERIFPVLAPGQIDRISAKGRLRRVQRGEVLVEPGQRAAHFFVLVAGEMEIVRGSGTTEELVAVYRPGMFTGERR